MKKLIIFTDGGARGNPGPAAVGVIIKTETGQVLNTISRTIGETTNNVAEYQGVVAALTWLRENLAIISRHSGIHDAVISHSSQTASGQLFNKPINEKFIIQFFLDSKLVVNQLNGLYKVKENHLRELILKVRLLEQEVGGEIYYNLVPREKNWEADSLVNKALDCTNLKKS